MTTRTQNHLGSSHGLLARSFEIRLEYDELKKHLSLPKNIKKDFNLDIALWFVEPKNGVSFNKNKTDLLAHAKALSQEYIDIYNSKVG